MEAIDCAPNRIDIDPWVTLIARIGTQDQTALDELRRLTLGRLFAVAKRILVSAEDAEEIAFDVLLWVWRNPDRFDPSRGTVAAWLNNLAWSRAIDLHRKRKRREDLLHPGSGAETYEENVKNPDERLNAFVDQGRVHIALSELTAEQRRLVLLAFFEGLSHLEIAEQTGKPLGTVKSLIRRGLIHMRKKLDQLEGGQLEGRQNA